MKQSLLIVLGVLAAANSFSQQKCDSKNLQADRIQLQNFWTTFKDAISHNDKVKLASLVRFPFTCDYCIIDSTKQNNSPYIEVSKAAFAKSQYRIFFADSLAKEVNKHNLPLDFPIFEPYYNTLEKKCSYSFQYVAIDENAQHPGMQHFFDIQRVNDHFKIISTWTLP